MSEQTKGRGARRPTGAGVARMTTDTHASWPHHVRLGGGSHLSSGTAPRENCCVAASLTPGVATAAEQQSLVTAPKHRDEPRRWGLPESEDACVLAGSQHACVLTAPAVAIAEGAVAESAAAGASSGDWMDSRTRASGRTACAAALYLSRLDRAGKSPRCSAYRHRCCI